MTELFIVSTPIGNLKDISQRAIETIKESDVVICENPQHSLKLLNKLGIKKKLISLHDYNEKGVISKVSKEFLNKKIALISDAGSPLISDPGFKFLQYSISNNFKISSVPGATALIPGLQLSGIPINRFNFLGFFPKNTSDMKEFINEIKTSETTTVFYVSSHKVKKCLEFIEEEMEDRLISIAKELTKINERVIRGTVIEIKNQLLNNKVSLKGEFVIVVEGTSQKKSSAINNIELYNEEIKKLLSKFSLTDVVEIVHKLTGITKNKIYKWALKLKKS